MEKEVASSANGTGAVDAGCRHRLAQPSQCLPLLRRADGTGRDEWAGVHGRGRGSADQLDDPFTRHDPVDGARAGSWRSILPGPPGLGVDRRVADVELVLLGGEGSKR